jgi:hypothetical protein
VIAYGSAVADEHRYERCARAGIDRLREPSAPVYEVRESGSLFGAYNEILDQAAADPRVEALVLMHEDTAIVEPDFEAKAREALADPQVAIAGAVGAIGIGGIDWWVHERMLGRVTLRLEEQFPPWGPPLIGSGTVVGPGGGGEVDTVDGFLLILSRWVIDELRFDESLGPGFHGYDADLCFQARERGRRVMVVEIDVEHHDRWRELADTEYRSGWKRAHAAFRRKWEGRMPLRIPTPEVASRSPGRPPA